MSIVNGVWGSLLINWQRWIKFLAYLTAAVIVFFVVNETNLVRIGLPRTTSPYAVEGTLEVLLFLFSLVLFLFSISIVIYKLFRTFTPSHPVLSSLGRVLIREAVDGQKPVVLPQGIIRVLDKLQKGDDPVILDQHFHAHFLDAATKFRPSSIYAFWDTEMYPVEAAIGADSFQPLWSDFGDVLTRLYKNSSGKNNLRFFVVADTFDPSRLPAEWAWLIAKHKLWGVKVYWIKKTDFKRCMNGAAPVIAKEWNDFAIFKMPTSQAWSVGVLSKTGDSVEVMFTKKRENILQFEKFCQRCICEWKTAHAF